MWFCKCSSCIHLKFSSSRSCYLCSSIFTFTFKHFRTRTISKTSTPSKNFFCFHDIACQKKCRLRVTKQTKNCSRVSSSSPFLESPSIAGLAMAKQLRWIHERYGFHRQQSDHTDSHQKTGMLLKKPQTILRLASHLFNASRKHDHLLTGTFRSQIHSRLRNLTSFVTRIVLSQEPYLTLMRLLVSTTDSVGELFYGCLKLCRCLCRVTFGPLSSLERIGDFRFAVTGIE